MDGWMYVCMYECLHVCMYAFGCLYACMETYMHVCVCLYMCMPVHVSKPFSTHIFMGKSIGTKCPAAVLVQQPQATSDLEPKR